MRPLMRIGTIIWRFRLTLTLHWCKGLLIHFETWTITFQPSIGLSHYLVFCR